MLSISNDKTESPKGFLSGLLGLKAGEKSDKFSLLLDSFSLDKGVEKGFKFGNIDALTHSNKKDKHESPDTKLSLGKLFSLGNEEANDEEQIHTDLIKAFPAKGLKENLQQLIGEAKSFLKEQITQKIDLKELPNTLGGLIKLAEKSGIDVRAISFESLPQTAVKEELSQVIHNFKPSLSAIPHSTSELVKPASEIKANKDASSQKPLNALLNQTKEALLIQGGDNRFSVHETSNTVKPSLFNASLNALLHGENSEKVGENELGGKIDGEKGSDKSQILQHTKTDQLTQKITEAKQLVQHVAQSMKEAVENYKPPFTRIKMQLNPQKFGEMDVTLIQRGSNVHININANTTALTVMMQNAHELKSALSTQGMGDAQMNFSSHQHQHNEQHKHEHAHEQYEAYQEFENIQEEFDEVATTLEIVVPRYI